MSRMALPLIALALTALPVGCVSRIPSTPTASPQSSPQVGNASALSPSTVQAVGEGTFTGVHTDVGHDVDGNGLFEHLKVDVELTVTRAGILGFMPVLLDSSGSLIAWGDLYAGFDRQAPLLTATLGQGVRTVSIYFNGRAIRDYGSDGPYYVRVDLVDGIGDVVASRDLAIGFFNHLHFQGLLPQLQAVGDTGVDTDSLPGYNWLRVTVQVGMAGAGNVTLQGQLFAGSTHLGDTMATATWSAGTHSLDLAFPGEAIAASGLDGPYTVYLTIGDGNYSANAEHTTSAYSSIGFQRARRP